MGGVGIKERGVRGGVMSILQFVIHDNCFIFSGPINITLKLNIIDIL